MAGIIWKWKKKDSCCRRENNRIGGGISVE